MDVDGYKHPPGSDYVASNHKQLSRTEICTLYTHFFVFQQSNAAAYSVQGIVSKENVYSTTVTQYADQKLLLSSCPGRVRERVRGSQG